MPIVLNEVTLPGWLDNYIFKQLEAQYCRSNSDMTVIDWTPDKILCYLGTYFPRSYAEGYSIFKQYLQSTGIFSVEDSLRVLDFGCGTGGEIIGIATAIAECRPNIKTLHVKAIDGNQFALNRFDDIKDEFNKRFDLQISSTPSAIKIDDFYDLSILDHILDNDYHIIVSFKAVCEFVTKQQFEEKNAYEYIAKFMTPRLANNGLMLLVDVTSKNMIAQEWLPNIMDKGLANAGVSVIARNPYNNASFIVNHSRQHGDVSKIAWRLIKNK